MSRKAPDPIKSSEVFYTENNKQKVNTLHLSQGRNYQLEDIDKRQKVFLGDSDPI